MTRLLTSALPLLLILLRLPSVHAAPPCPKEQLELRPTAGGISSNGEIRDSPNTSEYCSKIIGQNLIVSWPYDLGQEMNANEMDQLIRNRVIAIAERSLDRYLPMFRTTPLRLRAKNFGKRIVIAIFHDVLVNESYLEGFHLGGKIYLMVNRTATDPESGTLHLDMLEYTLAHEIVHAFQEIARGTLTAWQEPKKWLIEGIPNWGAERVFPNHTIANGWNGYHWGVRHFWQSIGTDGLLSGARRDYHPFNVLSHALSVHAEGFNCAKESYYPRTHPLSTALRTHLRRPRKPIAPRARGISVTRK